MRFSFACACVPIVLTPERFIYGVDYEGNVCGTNNIDAGIVPIDKAKNFSDSKFLYFMPASFDLDKRGYIDIFFFPLFFSLLIFFDIFF